MNATLPSANAELAANAELVFEAQVRSLRDYVFEQESTDSNWEHSRDRWFEPENLAWLKGHAAKKETGA